MPEYNSKDIDYLLDVSSVLGRDFQARMKHFEEKAELLGFSKVIFSKVHSRSKNKFIEELDSYPKEKLNLQIEGTITKKSLIGVYFFILEDESTINESTWSEFKSGKKISNFNKHGKDCQKILYIGQRNSSVVSRLVNHTVKRAKAHNLSHYILQSVLISIIQSHFIINVWLRLQIRPVKYTAYYLRRLLKSCFQQL